MKCSFIALSSVLLLLAVTAPQAATIYQATAAQSSPFNDNGGMALWRFTDNAKYDFKVGKHGNYRENNNGKARLVGRVFRINNGQTDLNDFYKVDIRFSGRTSSAPPGSPKLELKPGANIDPNTFHYYIQAEGTLTDRLGNVLNVSGFGPAAQVGAGANGKNTNFGFASWIQINHDNKHWGDLNVDLSHPSTIPLPPAVWLLGSALLPILSWRRKTTA